MKKILEECIALAKEVNSKIKKKLHEEVKIELSNSAVKNNLKDIEDKFEEHLVVIGKPETISIEKIIKLNNDDSMSHLMKHCVVAVMPNLSNEEDDIAFIGAHNICTWSLKNHGHVNSNGKLTGKGRKREIYHTTECENRDKKDRMYEKIYKKVFKSLISQKAKDKKTISGEFKLVNEATKDIYYSFLAISKNIVKDEEITVQEEKAVHNLLKAIEQLEGSVEDVYGKAEEKSVA